MKAVVQRVSGARVSVGEEVAGEIGPGLCVLLGVAREDGAGAAARLAEKVARLRIFENDEGRFDRSLLDTGGEALVVSQFTLVADSDRPVATVRWEGDDVQGLSQSQRRWGTRRRALH